MLNDLKKEITDCYMYGEIICQQGFGPKTDISMHDMIRFDLLQFLVYLTDSSDGSLYPETRFLHEYLGQYFTLESLMQAGSHGNSRICHNDSTFPDLFCGS